MKTALCANIVRKKNWANAKPTQEELDSAERVVRWLSDHAVYYPDEYGADDADRLAMAANTCHVLAEDLKTE